MKKASVACGCVCQTLPTNQALATPNTTEHSRIALWALLRSVRGLLAGLSKQNLASAARERSKGQAFWPLLYLMEKCPTKPARAYAQVDTRLKDESGREERHVQER